MNSISHETTRLDNGAILCLINDDRAASVRVEIEFPRAGRDYADPTKIEVPHVAEHMVFMGTRDIPTSRALIKELVSLTP